MTDRPLRHATRLVVFGLVLGVVLYLSYLAIGAI